MLSPLSRLIFPPSDDHQLSFTYEDNMRIEPEWSHNAYLYLICKAWDIPYL